MKKALALLLFFLALAGAGLWMLVRREPGTAPPEEAAAGFQVEPFGAGFLYRYADGQTPLRALKWMPPLPGGIQILQVVSQSNRQRVVVFRHGVQTADFHLPRPEGLREGFFNFAELVDAHVAGDLALLLYSSSSTTSGELPLVIALELPSGSLRWVHRAAGQRLALGPEAKDRAVFLFGVDTPILRLPLELAKDERLGPTPARKGIKAVDLPEEIKTVSDLLPTGSWGFLVAHGSGLSAYSSAKGWIHHPLPAPGPHAFRDSHGVLASARGFWWQPSPGSLLSVSAEGEPTGPGDLLPQPPQPWERDRTLLRLKGADPQGNLWFTLATPLTPSPLATPESTAPQEPGAVAPASAEAQPLESEEWAAHLARGLDRLYRWNPERRSLQVVLLPRAWPALPLPKGIVRPSACRDLNPASGDLLVESGPVGYRTPLETLVNSGN